VLGGAGNPYVHSTEQSRSVQVYIFTNGSIGGISLCRYDDDYCQKIMHDDIASLQKSHSMSLSSAYNLFCNLMTSY